MTGADHVGTLIELRVKTPVETPLLKELIDLGAENIATAARPNDIHDIHDINDIHNIGKVDLNSGGASGQVEQGAAYQVVEDQAPVADTTLLKNWSVATAPLPKDLINRGAEDNHSLSKADFKPGAAGGRVGQAAARHS